MLLSPPGKGQEMLAGSAPFINMYKCLFGVFVTGDMVIIFLQADLLIAFFCGTSHQQGIQDAQKRLHRALKVSRKAGIVARRTIATQDFQAPENAGPAKDMLAAGLHGVSQDVFADLAGNGFHKVFWEVQGKKLGAKMHLATVRDLPQCLFAAQPCLSSSLALTSLSRSVNHSLELFAELHVGLLTLPLESPAGTIADVTGRCVGSPLHGGTPGEVHLTGATAKLPVHEAPAVVAELSGVHRIEVRLHINSENLGNEVWPGSDFLFFLSQEALGLPIHRPMDWISPLDASGLKRISTNAAELSEVGLMNCFVSSFLISVRFLQKLGVRLRSCLRQDWLQALRLVWNGWRWLKRKFLL